MNSSTPPSRTPLPVSIEYCVVCGHLARALSLAEDILLVHPERVSSMTLLPSSGGVYEVRFGERLLHSRLATGVFPDDETIVDLIGAS